MIAEHHHSVKPFKIFQHGETWDHYQFVKAYRNCWIWHIVTGKGYKPDKDVWYVTECPDGRCYTSNNMTKAQTIAGRWDNGMDPVIPKESEGIL